MTRVSAGLLGVAGLVTGLAAGLVAFDAHAQDVASIAPNRPSRARQHLVWSRVREGKDGYAQVDSDGTRIELTLEPAAQHAAEAALGDSGALYGAAVILSVDDGRVLAMAGHSPAKPSAGADELALTAWAPAASIFKLVTAAALVGEGVDPTTKVCYHDGIHSVESSNLVAHRRWDTSCQSLAYGLAKSQNAILARLAHDHLDPLGLERIARGLGFGASVPFELPVRRSELAVPRGDALGFARTAAGFWNTTMSPLHGAALAAVFARGGVTAPVRLIERIVGSDGDERHVNVPTERRVLPAAVARAVGQMMVGTTEFGTARLGFHDRRGKPLLPGVAVAGKTGTLNRKISCPPAEVGCAGDTLTYSWFVGYAPADHPTHAFAVLLGNGADWKKKAHQVTAEMLRTLVTPHTKLVASR